MAFKNLYLPLVSHAACKVSTSRQKGVDLVKKLSFYYRCNGQFFVQIEMHANCKKMNSKNFRETDQK